MFWSISSIKETFLGLIAGREFLGDVVNALCYLQCGYQCGTMDRGIGCKKDQGGQKVRSDGAKEGLDK